MNLNIRFVKWIQWTCFVGAGFLLVSCGGGSSNGSSATPSTSYTTLSAQVLGKVTTTGATFCLDTNKSGSCGADENQKTVSMTDGVVANSGFSKEQCGSGWALLTIPKGVSDTTYSRTTTNIVTLIADCANIDSNNLLIFSPLTTLALRSDSSSRFNSAFSEKFSGKTVNTNFITNSSIPLGYLNYAAQLALEETSSQTVNLFLTDVRALANEISGDPSVTAGTLKLTDIPSTWSSYQKDRVTTGSDTLMAGVSERDDVALASIPATLYELIAYGSSSNCSSNCSLLINKLTFTYDSTSVIQNGERLLGTTQTTTLKDYAIKKNTVSKNNYRLNVQNAEEQQSIAIVNATLLYSSFSEGNVARFFSHTLHSDMSAKDLTAFLKKTDADTGVINTGLSCSSGLSSQSVLYRITNRNDASLKRERYLMNKALAESLVANCSQVGVLDNAGNFSDTGTVN